MPTNPCEEIRIFSVPDEPVWVLKVIAVLAAVFSAIALILATSPPSPL